MFQIIQSVKLGHSSKREKSYSATKI